jgi:hypothetical protein
MNPKIGKTFFSPAAATLILIVGCTSSRSPLSGDDATLKPITPVSDTPSGKNNGPDWAWCLRSATALSSLTGVTHLVLIYASGGRDFRDPPGPDGYILRVIPLDKDRHPTSVSAEVHIGLFDNPPRPNSQGRLIPIQQWFLDAKQLKNYWRRDALLDGYLFPLDWGESSTPPGRYLFLVYMNHPKKNNSAVCQQITFQNVVEQSESAHQPPAASTAAPSPQEVSK